MFTKTVSENHLKNSDALFLQKDVLKQDDFEATYKVPMLRSRFLQNFRKKELINRITNLAYCKAWAGQE